uniref:Uncharacterized protein n=1 Tax=Ditylenchus dipsaci TaxID=166011 RepID=A0A915E642_9BILA
MSKCCIALLCATLIFSVFLKYSFYLHLAPRSLQNSAKLGLATNRLNSSFLQRLPRSSATSDKPKPRKLTTRKRRRTTSRSKAKSGKAVKELNGKCAANRECKLGTLCSAWPSFARGDGIKPKSRGNESPKSSGTCQSAGDLSSKADYRQWLEHIKEEYNEEEKVTVLECKPSSAKGQIGRILYMKLGKK